MAVRSVMNRHNCWLIHVKRVFNRTAGLQKIDENNQQERRRYLEKINVEEENLRQRLKTLQNAAAERTKIMEALHEYNDVKDAAQVVLGQLAASHNVTVLEMHEKFDLHDAD